MNSNESVPLTLKKKSLWAEPRVKGADNVHDTHTGRRVSIPSLRRLTEKRRQLWRSGHQGAVGREEALHWQLLVNDQPGGFHSAALVVSASSDSRVAGSLWVEDAGLGVHSLGFTAVSGINNTREVLLLNFEARLPHVSFKTESFRS